MLHVKKFFEHNSVRGAIGSRELLDFKRACSEAEWTEFTQVAEAYCAAAGI